MIPGSFLLLFLMFLDTYYYSFNLYVALYCCRTYLYVLLCSLSSATHHMLSEDHMFVVSMSWSNFSLAQKKSCFQLFDHFPAHPRGFLKSLFGRMSWETFLITPKTTHTHTHKKSHSNSPHLEKHCLYWTSFCNPKSDTCISIIVQYLPLGMLCRGTSLSQMKAPHMCIWVNRFALL